jgi:hypothetical protein
MEESKLLSPEKTFRAARQSRQISLGNLIIAVILDYWAMMAILLPERPVRKKLIQALQGDHSGI